MSLQRGIAILLGFAGLAVLVAPRIAAEGGLSGEAAGLAAAITGALCYAIANVQTKLAAPVSPAIAATIYCLAGFLVALPAGFAAPLNTQPSLASVAALIVLGVFSTALGGIFFVFLVRRRGPVFTSFVTYLMPLWALGLGVLVMGEKPGWNAIYALALVLSGLALFNMKAIARRGG
jgi:drug/metabolite transporter (DMT)-like permease